MLKLPKLPKLPNPEQIPEFFDHITKGIDYASQLVEIVGKGIDKVADALGKEDRPPAATKERSLTKTSPKTEPSTQPETSSGASNEVTLKYQLDLILDDLEHLEVEHLPGQGRLNGEICDCIAKAAISLRRHAKETVPIASRQGEDPHLFSELTGWAQHLMDIGTIDQVTTGQHDDEYLEQAGTASNYRKRVAPMFAKVCPHCEEVREKAKRFAEKMKGKGEAEEV